METQQQQPGSNPRTLSGLTGLETVIFLHGITGIISGLLSIFNFLDQRRKNKRRYKRTPQLKNSNFDLQLIFPISKGGLAYFAYRTYSKVSNKRTVFNNRTRHSGKLYVVRVLFST